MADGGATRSPCGSNDPSAGEQQHFMGRKRRSLVIGTGVRSRVRSRLAFVTSTTHECGIQSWRCFVARWWPVIGIQSRLARGRGVEGRSLRVGDVSHVDRPVAATEQPRVQHIDPHASRVHRFEYSDGLALWLGLHGGPVEMARSGNQQQVSPRRLS